ncbi:hypothetical protein SBRY_50153 [Actinacidiphila bryophytorum]|uniref:Uncharacterized protein n=1 Tax=Actinacidiphila bryophytorum TaxID=1436133 RepID=A0A9W4MCT3_9ACTN|nr:hypothetical protein SBRY_50153 [Actinacidiphila bryophytorum]
MRGRREVHAAGTDWNWSGDLPGRGHPFSGYLASRRPAGWATADHMRTELVTDALTAAERTRGSLAGAILHTNHSPNTPAGP